MFQRPASRAAGVDRPDRADRHGSPCDSGHSPSRTGKRRASDLDETFPAETAKPDRKQKGSVFSRISFPDSSSAGAGGGGGGGSSGEGATKRRKSSELPLKNGLRDQHESAHHRSSSVGHREEWKGAKGGGSSSIGGRRGGCGGGYDHESSEEDYHFKRRPSSSRREAEDDGRPARGSRERETYERGSKRR